MKILMTLMGLDIGGAETHVAELSKALHRQGHEILIASNGGAYVPELEASGIRHMEVPMHQRDPRLMLRSLRLLRQVILREKPDLVHAHARIPAFLCGILQKQLHFPMLTSAHGVFTVTPLLRLMTNWGDRTVAVSEDIRRYLMENYRVPADQIHVTINGIDTEQFAPRPGDPALRQALGLGSGPVVGLVSRLDELCVLAPGELIQIAPQLAERFPGLQLLLVGGGNAEQALRAAAKQVNGRAGRNLVVMTGARTDVSELVAQCDVFVGVSRAALEAMAAAKPVVLAGNQGYLGTLTPEVLQTAQESNFCCRGGPVVTGEGLLEALTALLRLPEEQRRQLGAFGRQVILDQYSVQRMTADYLAAYEALLHPKKTVTAVISGYYGYDNLGDDAILCAIGRQLEQTKPPVRLVVLSRQPKQTAQKFGFRAVPRFSPLKVFGALRRCDVLISGGGSLLQDRTSTRSLLYYLAVIRLAQRLKKPVFLYANGIGPLNHKGNRRRVCRVLERCDRITLRDADSLEELRALGITRPDLTVTADPAFTLQPVAEAAARRRLRALGIPEGQPLVGISVRRSAGMNRAAPAFAGLCDRLSRELGYGVVLLVMQEPGDRQVSQEIQSRMQEPSYLLSTPNEPETMLGVIGCMELIVSMRLHTIVFAAKERVPAVGCVYDPKVEAFLRMLDMPDCGRPEELTADQAMETIRELLDHLEEKRRQLDRTVCEMERQTQDTDRLLLELLNIRIPAED